MGGDPPASFFVLLFFPGGPGSTAYGEGGKKPDAGISSSDEGCGVLATVVDRLMLDHSVDGAEPELSHDWLSVNEERTVGEEFATRHAASSCTASAGGHTDSGALKVF